MEYRRVIFQSKKADGSNFRFDSQNFLITFSLQQIANANKEYNILTWI